MSGNSIRRCRMPSSASDAVLGEEAARHGEADARHGGAEEVPVLRRLDGGQLGADQLDAVAVERAVLGQRHGEVQAGLAAHRRQERIRPLPLDDLRHELRGERLDVRPLRHLRVRHDRGGIGVDEDHLEALFAERLHGLRARVVELARLPDDDGPRADQENLLDVGALRHRLLVTLPPVRRPSTCPAAPRRGGTGRRRAGRGRSTATSPLPQSFSARTLMRFTTRSLTACASIDSSLSVVNTAHSGFCPVSSVFR